MPQARGEGGLSIEISVADTGIGIPANNQESVFDSLSNEDTGPDAGGLGLPMCKGLVELMGGKIWIESSEDQGTTVRFTVLIELDLSDTTWQPDKDVIEDPGGEFTGNLSENYPHKILVVEDDNINRRILRMHLKKMGYQPDEAADGQQAVAAVMTGNYDMVFMDLRMPNMNGIEATRWIREHFSSAGDLRIIALTGDATPEIQEQCEKAGLDDFVPKPVQGKDLEAILRS